MSTSYMVFQKLCCFRKENHLMGCLLNSKKMKWRKKKKKEIIEIEIRIKIKNSIEIFTKL